MENTTQTKKAPQISMEEVLRRLPELFTAEHIKETCVVTKDKRLFINVSANTLECEENWQTLKVKPFLAMLDVKLKVSKRSYRESFDILDTTIVNEVHRDQLVNYQAFTTDRDSRRIFEALKALIEEKFPEEPEEGKARWKVYLVADVEMAVAFRGDVNWFDLQAGHGKYRLNSTHRYPKLEIIEE